MPRKVFYSFHYGPDNWRVSQVRNIGSIEGNTIASDNDWETIKRGGDAAVQKWIDGQIVGRSCCIVLIGSETAGRKWINYEIEQCWKEGKGLLGIHIHNLKDRDSRVTTKGNNPFNGYTLNNGTVTLSSIVKVYDPPYYMSTEVYAHIKANVEQWIETAITTRNNYA